MTHNVSYATFTVQESIWSLVKKFTDDTLVIFFIFYAQIVSQRAGLFSYHKLSFLKSPGLFKKGQSPQ